jgi:hypothetical protein
LDAGKAFKFSQNIQRHRISPYFSAFHGVRWMATAFSNKNKCLHKMLDSKGIFMAVINRDKKAAYWKCGKHRKINRSTFAFWV